MKNLLSLALLFLIVSINPIDAESQLMSTGMRITVLSRLGNTIENAKVTVYQNKKDYESEENAIAGPAFTDEKGRVTFKNLEEKEYYVQVIKGDDNNYGDAEQTGKLKKGKINKFNIVIQ
jgi:uncharacterized GH25 family protein